MGRKLVACLFASMIFVAMVASADDGLVAHWPLARDARDAGPAARHAEAHGTSWYNAVTRKASDEAIFDGRSSHISAPGEAWGFGTSDFTVTLRATIADGQHSGSIDLLSAYDPATRRGWQLSLKSHSVTTSQTNTRTLHFGLDNGQSEQPWQDHGRPGNAILIYSLAVHDGKLYVGTCEPGPQDVGKVVAFDGQQFRPLPPVTNANSISALTTYDGQLCAGSAKYRLAGSALPESENENLGGQVKRWDGAKWLDCGRLPERQAIGGFTIYRGRLHATSLYRPAGFFRYDDEGRWTELPSPDGKRAEALCVYRGNIWASSYDSAHVYRWDSERWIDCGQVGDETNTQTYSFAVYQGELYVGTWRSGKVYRFRADNHWVDCGRLGEELEVMGMLVHNGRLYAGSLPTAQVFRYDGGTTWTSVGQVDATPNVTYRRAWTMAEYQGRLFVGTLPTGKLLSTSVGTNVTYDTTLPTGPHTIAAVRSGPELRLYVDGRIVARSKPFAPSDYDLSGPLKLTIGRGQNDYFEGRMSDIRVYRRALTDSEIADLSQTK